MSILSIPLLALLEIVRFVLGLYQFAVITYIVMGWLEYFEVINRYNHAVYLIQTFLFRLVEPALACIRRFLPILSGIDLSPLVLMLFISFVINMIERILH